MFSGDSGYGGDGTRIPVDFEMPTESTRIPVDKLSVFIEDEKKKGDEAFDQYHLIPKVTSSTRDFGANDANSSKNRYTCNIPYDHNRIVLTEIEGDPYRSYINASLVPGYSSDDKRFEYIVAQGPKKETVSDFWRMIWQCRVEKIVMLTALMAEGKEKCAKYWPEKSDVLQCDEGIQVRTSSEQVSKDYTLREIELQKDGQTRQVTQFHFTSWPDMGVPDKMTLLRFRNQEIKLEVTEGTPTVVHCTAGLGRAGTFLSMDNLLRQAAAEKAVDIFKWMLHLRSCRANAVETVEQYQFIHESVLAGLSLASNEVTEEAATRDS